MKLYRKLLCKLRKITWEYLQKEHRHFDGIVGIIVNAIDEFLLNAIDYCDFR